jgi:NADH-ubiquinone oxidoreductase chain 2
MPKISIFVILLTLLPELSSRIDFGDGETTAITRRGLLLICSALSLIVGTIGGLGQTRIKRLLTYSTISHVGFILLRVDSPFLFYLLQYTITNLNIFLILLAFSKKDVE